MLRRVSFVACLTALVLLSALRADAQLPNPKEDATKLTKPTISYNSYDDYEVRLMDWDGTNDRLWLGDGKIRFASGIRWSPTGERAAIIVYDNVDRSYTPYLIDLKTGRSKNMMDALRIPKAEGTYNFMAWSPDGRWLTMVDTWYVTNVIVHGYVYKVNVDTGKFVRLTKHAWMYPEDPAWSSDGERIAFSALKEPKLEGFPSNRDIFVMNADGSNVVNVTDHPAWDEFPTWSPDGKKIGFRSYRDNQDLEVERVVQRAELYIMDPDGSNVERLFNNAGWEGMVNWAPDSQWFIYQGGPVDPADLTSVGIYRMHIPTRKSVLIKRILMRDPSWVLAGKSRFLSIDPAGKKKAQWGALKEADSSPNSPTSQDVE